MRPATASAIAPSSLADLGPSSSPSWPRHWPPSPNAQPSWPEPSRPSSTSPRPGMRRCWSIRCGRPPPRRIRSLRPEAGPYSAKPMTGPVELGEHRYGKERIRLVRVIRGPAGHTVRDLTVAVSMEGRFGAAYTAGDNTGVVATDTMKNTVYALAGEHLKGSIEDFALSLARHFVEAPSVQRATVSIDEAAWRPIEVSESHPSGAFVQDRSWIRTAQVSVGRTGAAGTTAEAGGAGAQG